METNCPGGPVERLVGRLRVAATKLGRSDEWEDLRDDLHHAAAEIERLAEAERDAARKNTAVQNVMAMLADWLDDDKFNTVESNIIGAGFTPPELV